MPVRSGPIEKDPIRLQNTAAPRAPARWGAISCRWSSWRRPVRRSSCAGPRSRRRTGPWRRSSGSTAATPPGCSTAAARRARAPSRRRCGAAAQPSAPRPSPHFFPTSVSCLPPRRSDSDAARAAGHLLPRRGGPAAGPAGRVRGRRGAGAAGGEPAARGPPRGGDGGVPRRAGQPGAVDGRHPAAAARRRRLRAPAVARPLRADQGAPATPGRPRRRRARACRRCARESTARRLGVGVGGEAS